VKGNKNNEVPSIEEEERNGAERKVEEINGVWEN
jgi:hypothetical protein